MDFSGRKVNDSMGSYVADMAIKAMIEAGQAPKKSTVLILGLTFKENCPDIRNSKVIDIIHKLREYDIEPVVADPVAAEKEYNVKLVGEETVAGTADCVIVAVGHKEYRGMSMMKLKELFKRKAASHSTVDEDRGTDSAEKVLIDVKSLYRIDELRASGLRFWRL